MLQNMSIYLQPWKIFYFDAQHEKKTGGEKIDVEKT